MSTGGADGGGVVGTGGSVAGKGHAGHGAHVGAGGGGGGGVSRHGTGGGGTGGGDDEPHATTSTATSAERARVFIGPGYIDATPHGTTEWLRQLAGMSHRKGLGDTRHRPDRRELDVHVPAMCVSSTTSPTNDWVPPPVKSIPSRLTRPSESM